MQHRLLVTLAALGAYSLALLGLSGCTSHPESGEATPAAASAASPSASSALHGADASPLSRLPIPLRLANRAAYIPPQCFTKTRGAGDDPQPKNPCYVCHTRGEPPNFSNDEDLQLRLSLPALVAKNPWSNLLESPGPPRRARAGRRDPRLRPPLELLRAAGPIALAAKLARVPPEWDANHNGKWDGFVPDVFFAFDDRGFDHRPDGTPSGWRAFAYYPFPGSFFPTNGSADDVAIRLATPVPGGQSGPRRQPRVRGEPRDRRGAHHARRRRRLIRRTRPRSAWISISTVASGARRALAFDAAAEGSGKTRMHYVGRGPRRARGHSRSRRVSSPGTELFTRCGTSTWTPMGSSRWRRG